MIQISGSNASVVKLVGDGEYIVVNNNSYRTPKKGLFGIDGSISLVNGRVYINGYELVNGKWKVTIGSLFHLFF